MATDTATPPSGTDAASIFEAIGDRLSAFGEGFVGLLTRVLGSSNENYVRKLGYIRPNKGAGQPHTVTPGSLLAQINSHEEAMAAKSPDELRGMTAHFRERLAKGEKLDSLLPEAFAACRESAKRTKNMRHFDVQMLGGIVLHRGNIAEMVTGEGKTLVATLPAFLNALEGEGCHVITVNDYLARRDCEWMLPIFQALGMSAGFIQSDMDPDTRRNAYDADITYGTASEFGFDYLRDNMKPARWGDPHFHASQHQCQKELHYAIIDEVDNILIDEARTPLIISGPAHSDTALYAKANDIAVKLNELQKRDGVQYYEVKEKEHTCHLTDEGVRKAEELAGVESFYTAGNTEWPHLMDNALKAHHLYKRDKNYMIMADRDNPRELAIIIIDEHTGRAMFGRQWSDGLHQAVEAKHQRDGVQIKQETQTLATVTLQNFFKLYGKLAGMTGTAMTEANEFWKIYKLDVIAIPTNRPMLRVNSPDLVYRSEREMWDAVVTEVIDVNATGRPILIGTASVEKSEKLADMLKRKGIKHELLNAKPERVAREAEIVSQAGRKGAVTIATNMAGRGTDIILGGNPETLAWAQLKQQFPTRLDVPEELWKSTVDAIEAKEKMKAQGKEIIALGGLHIIGTERHESRRIDNQLRGRAGRQGDPGSSRFFLSLQDDLMRIYGGERMAGLLTRLGMTEGEAIESKMVSRQIQGAQKKVEEQHFEARKNLLEYDEVMDHQRRRTYGFRQQILNDHNPKAIILEMIDQQVEAAVVRLLDENYGPASFAEFCANRLGVEFEPTEFRNISFEDAANLAQTRAYAGIVSAVQESLDENLDTGTDESEWQWQEMSRQMNSRFELKTTDRELKKIGRDGLTDYLVAAAEKTVGAISLSEGAKYLQADWGARSVADWAKQKFGLLVDPSQITGQTPAQVTALLKSAVRGLYRRRDIEFPVQHAIAHFMGDKNMGPAGPRYDRPGLFSWATYRYPRAAQLFQEDEFRTQSKSKLAESIFRIAESNYPKVDQEAITARIDAALEGAAHAEAADAAELVEWYAKEVGIEVPAEQITGQSAEDLKQILWNIFDEAYRPEMRGMERSVVLSQLDDAWKKHLLTMDHLRSGVGLVGYAQVDPKTEYKREGMREFEQMWVGVRERITENVFRMEEEAGFVELRGVASQEAPTAATAPALPEMTTNAGGGDKKVEPIRNELSRVGRNDPCPCGSGKKYKNCHMRQAGPVAGKK